MTKCNLGGGGGGNLGGGSFLAQLYLHDSDTLVLHDNILFS